MSSVEGDIRRLLSKLKADGCKQVKISFLFKWAGTQVGCVSQEGYAQVCLEVTKILRTDGYEKKGEYLIL